MNAGQKIHRARPPDKGSFPLDHEGQCKEFMKRYMECLAEKDQEHVRCREAARDYLQCRMDKELMTKEDFSKLGFKEHNKNKSTNSLQ